MTYKYSYNGKYTDILFYWLLHIEWYIYTLKQMYIYIYIHTYTYACIGILHT